MNPYESGAIIDMNAARKTVPTPVDADASIEQCTLGPAVEPKQEQQCKQARPHDELICELLDSRRPKTEREHAAAREIERLRDLCDDLYSDLLAAGSLAPRGCGAYALIQETIKLRRDRWARKRAPNAGNQRGAVGDPLD